MPTFRSTYALVCVLLLTGPACSAKQARGTATIAGVLSQPAESAGASTRGAREQSGINRSNPAASRQGRSDRSAGAAARGRAPRGMSAESSSPRGGAERDEFAGFESGAAANADAEKTVSRGPMTGAEPSDAPSAPQRTGATRLPDSSGLRGGEFAVLVVSAAAVLALAILAGRRFRRNARHQT